MRDQLFVVYENDEFVQAFEDEWRARDFIDDNVDCMRADVEARWARYSIGVYGFHGLCSEPRPR